MFFIKSCCQMDGLWNKIVFNKFICIFLYVSFLVWVSIYRHIIIVLWQYAGCLLVTTSHYVYGNWFSVQTPSVHWSFSIDLNGRWKLYNVDCSHGITYSHILQSLSSRKKVCAGLIGVLYCWFLLQNRELIKLNFLSCLRLEISVV